MQSWPAAAVPDVPGTPPDLRLYDSATAGLVDVAPADGTARLYVCGITPYDATHLGHAATYVAFDTLNRVWRDQGLSVHYVQNVTDIDDPLLERAARDGQDWRELAARETQLFREDMTALRVLPPTDYVGAVEAMDSISAAVARLVEAGAGYLVPSEDAADDVYFPVSTAPRFGEVSRLGRPEMTALFAERGGDPERPGKKDPLDSLLWRAERTGEPAWESLLGPGRAGWHVECAVIALDRLGARIDVQGGGSDLVFPHHEHSSATAEALSGRAPFAAANVHAGMIGLDGEKMSKSRGNLVKVSELRRDGVDPAAVRLGLLSGHYRQDRAWSPALLDRARRRLAEWTAAAARPAGPPAGPAVAEVRAALADDLDTPRALAAVDAWATEGGPDAAAPAAVRDLVDALLGVRLTPA